MNPQKNVGEKIRMYRKMRKMSLENLAEKIFKSRSIVSKYELGESAFDIETLYKIAEALDIEPTQLFEPRRQIADGCPRYGIFIHNKLYVYMLVKDRSYRLLRSMLVLNSAVDEQAVLYLQVPDFESYTRCKVTYCGKLSCFPGNCVLNLTNQADHSDQVSLYAAVKMNQQDSCTGMIMMSGYSTGDPGALKVLLTNCPIQDEQAAIDYLKVSRDDISGIRATNIYGYKSSAIDQALF